jgi:uncharacterized membrane protein YfcA
MRRAGRKKPYRNLCGAERTDDAMSPVAVLLALLIGASLGLVGGGGSILTVPALMHAVGFAPRDAIVASLIVVGIAAMAGALMHWRLGTLDLPVAGWFGGLGAVGALGGSRLGRLVPAGWLMAAFAVVAVAAGLTLMSRRGIRLPRVAPLHPGLVVVTALGVGFLTGLLGVGGGFLIVPALALVLGLPMARAVGTSLAVIAINCAAGLTTAAPAFDPERMLVTAVFAGLALTGTLIGARTAPRARPEVLRRVFGLLVLGVGVYTGAVALV